MNWKGLKRKSSVVLYSLTCILLTIRLVQVSIGEERSNFNNRQTPTTTPSLMLPSTRRPFIFHASPISGIDNIMQLLSDHCTRKRLRCLSLQEQCRQSSYEDAIKCNTQSNLVYNDQIYIDMLTLTSTRLSSGCCQGATMFKYDGILIPLSLYHAENLALLKELSRNYTDAQHLIILQEPNEQFLSHYLLLNRTQAYVVPSLETTITHLESTTMGRKAPSQDIRLFYRHLPNAQSHYLGYRRVTYEENDDILDALVTRLKDCTVLFLDDIVEGLRHKIRSIEALKDFDYLPSSLNLIEKTEAQTLLHSLPETLKIKLETVQFADLRLYKTLYFPQHKYLYSKKNENVVETYGRK